MTVVTTLLIWLFLSAAAAALYRPAILKGAGPFIQRGLLIAAVPFTLLTAFIAGFGAAIVAPVILMFKYFKREWNG